MIHVRLDKEKIRERYLYYFSKRTFDVIASAIALVLLSPLFLYLIYRIRKEDGGKAIYSQTRVGKDGQTFRMYKFRSMFVNADQMLDQLKDQNEVNGAMFKIKNDPRVTKIGHTIRKYSLDELPQLWNVLLGDMSLVGPRPPLPSEVAEYTDYDKQRLLVVPGCTGLWQATKRNNADFDEMVELDLEYIKKSGFFYDMYIIFKTIMVMIHPNGAY